MAKTSKSKDTSDHSAAAKPAEIDPRLLEVLICPKTRGPLRYDRKTNELISAKAKLAFPVREGVPIMLVDEARSL